MECFGFRLATATAILTVLDPIRFSVYDKRVCEQLERSEKLSDRKFSVDLSNEYEDFLKAVECAVPGRHSLRDKDRYLWGKSFYKQCEKELSDGTS